MSVEIENTSRNDIVNPEQGLMDGKETSSLNPSSEKMENKSLNDRVERKSKRNSKNKMVFKEGTLVSASQRLVASSVRKLNLVARMIRGVKASKAVSQLAFSPKKVAYDVRKVLMSGIANAENNHGLDIDALYVKEAYVGKSMMLKRFSPRARGRGNRINKEYSKITIVLGECE